MGLRDRFNAGLARQLGRPSGLAGRVVGRVLNKGNRATIGAAVAALPLGRDAAVADVGFGGGVGLRLLLDRAEHPHVHGVELSSEMIKRARSNYAAELTAGRLELHRGSLTALPLPDSSLDGLLTVNTIYFVDDLDAVMGEFARTLKGGARAVIGVGDPEAMEKMPFTAHGFRLRSATEIAAAAATANLDLVDHQRLGGGSAPAHLLAFA